MASSSSKPAARERADVQLVQQGLAPSRARAQALILAGQVIANEQRVDKAGQLLDVNVTLRLRQPDHPYVSRGGVKLQSALDALQMRVEGWTVADFGVSTGGFCDCMLQRGAHKVYAIDVGYGQLHDRLRRDSRVIVMERTNARHLKSGDLPESVDLVTIDVSFISAAKLLDAAQAVLKDEGKLLIMVKPQFELKPADIGSQGVVRDENKRQEAIDTLVRQAKAKGFEECGRADSALRGPKGNQETFVLFSRVGRITETL